MRNFDPSAITVGDLQMHGVDEIRASCERCGESWQSPISFLPSGTSLSKIVQLMVCPKCGGSDLVVLAAWRGEVPKTN